MSSNCSALFLLRVTEVIEVISSCAHANMQRVFCGLCGACAIIHTGNLEVQIELQAPAGNVTCNSHFLKKFNSTTPSTHQSFPLD